MGCPNLESGFSGASLQKVDIDRVMTFWLNCYIVINFKHGNHRNTPLYLKSYLAWYIHIDSQQYL